LIFALKDPAFCSSIGGSVAEEIEDILLLHVPGFF
jgi:hypothetical protein